MENKIYNLENEISKLRNQLKIKEIELCSYKIENEKEILYRKYTDMLEYNEMELVYQLIFGYVICNEYMNPVYHKYLNKSAEFLNIWPSDVIKNFSSIIKLFQEYECLLDEEEVVEKFNKYLLNAAILEDDDIDQMISIFSS